MNVEKIAGDGTPCHAERSEASAALAHDALATQMLSEAKHDMFDIPSFFVNVHHRVPTKVGPLL